jgi:uncharacterized protein YdhG (YjbR/CyaY superfamily)
MSVIDNYLATLSGAEKAAVGRMYEVVRRAVPEATEEMYYGMPSFKYKGKGLAAVIVNRNFISFYPYRAVEGIDVDLSAYECTSGSIHFGADDPIPDDTLRKIITARMRQIDERKQN